MLDLLLKYKKVIETGNITKAAKQLFVTQSALTQSMQKLERNYDCTLLIRHRSGIKPTKSGELLYETAKAILQKERNIQKRIREVNNIASHEIRMGMIDNVGLIFVRNIYKQIVHNDSDINLQIEINNSTNLIQQVEMQSIDFAIITQPEKHLGPKFSLSSFATENLLLVGNKKIVDKIKDTDDLEHIPVLSYNKQSKTHKQIESTFHDNNISPQFKVFSSSPDFILEMVKQGVGIAVLPENIVYTDIRKKKIFLIQTGIRFARRLSLVHLASTYLADTTRQFIDELKREYSQT